jgi:hypothetical protein
LDDHRPARGRTVLFVILGIALVVSVVILGVWLVGRVPPGAGDLTIELRDRGRIAVIGGDDLRRLSADGAELVLARDVAGLDAALAGRDEAALEEALSARGIAGLLVDGRAPRPGDTLAARLSRYENIDVLRGVYLTPVAALYLRRRGMDVDPDDGVLLARAARQIISGARLPNVRSFPEPLRRSRSVEILIVLRDGERARLWRSARGGSMARAMVTAASVARDRWIEREAAMGGALDVVLPTLHVDVMLLEEDGTLGDRSAAFLDRSFTPAHGVAFEAEGSWHYLRPEATHERGQGSMVRAYGQLFDDAGERQDSLTRVDLRAYRIVTRLLGTSEPSPRSPSFEIDPLGPASLEGIDALP